MNVAVTEDEIFVEAPARLHFGVLDLHGGLGRWFGGIGAAAPAPTLLISACRAETVEVAGEDADRAVGFVRRFLAHHELPGGVRVDVHRALPVHVGLGSGTQLALAIARAMAELFNVSTSASELARSVGRTPRSAIGTWTFAGGGFVVDGGRRPGTEGVAPLLTRLPFPQAWRCIVAVPDAEAGVSGGAEATAFEQIPRPPEREVERVAHLVLMALLPALVEADLATFGAALCELQTITGGWFAPVQGGTFASGQSKELVRQMAAWRIPGVGQSSWGPAVYGIVEGEDEGRRLADRLRIALGTGGAVYEGPFRAEGARVWRAQQTPRQSDPVG